MLINQDVKSMEQFNICREVNGDKVKVNKISIKIS
ncbi:hypothetical protein BC952_2628 [Flavobacterium limicola]|uniref:Uncharacterized protein n=1 Tax=Flavobacterium limicola TaxID=180441 RepID=A0A495RYR7_9FLAO|nr:hypothetical protein BC952_2628 [Flavobacterium limicola]